MRWADVYVPHVPTSPRRRCPRRRWRWADVYVSGLGPPSPAWARRLRPGPAGPMAFILADEHHEILRNPVRHLDGVHNAADGFVVAAQVVDFARQILFDGAADALIQELGLLRAVEVAVQIGGRVQHLDVALRRRPPLDEGH